ncbi:MAG: TonB family protein [Myxococcota bacterium]|nr:TonB family protein [Myxococcota bacterium]
MTSWRGPARRWAFEILLLPSAVATLGPLWSVRAAAQPAASADVEPPALLEGESPAYPEGEAAAGRTAELELEVTVGVSGEVADVTVRTSGGAVFDEAAVTAVRGWRFEPARSGGEPVASRIRVPIRFAPEVEDPTPQPASTGGPAPDAPTATTAAESSDTPAPTEAGTEDGNGAAGLPSWATETDAEGLLEVDVLGERRPVATAAGDYVIPLAELRIVPRANVAEQIMMAPGVLTTNHGGEGHAHETFMRGFASREGQDIEYTVDGVPVNDVSNPHGHGYADLFFVPPEFVRAVSVTEGPFDPSQGDFAFAGSVDYELGVDEPGARVRYGYGLFDTHRLLLTYAPAEEPRDSFAGFEFYQTSGYGPNRAAERLTALGRYADVVEGSGLSWRVTAFGYAGRFDQAGVVRQDDYLDGTMGFLDCYDPNQGGESDRFLLTFDTASGALDSRFRQATWLGYRTMRLRTNFTGWLTDVTVTADGRPNVQRGDGLEMRYEVLTGGSRGSYDLSTTWWSLPQTLSLGYAARIDHGRSSQFRLRSVTAIPYLTVFDDGFTILNLVGWVRAQFRPLEWLTLRGGLRIDGFAFGVTDQNQPTGDREGARVGSQTSQSLGYAFNPRFTLDFRLIESLHLALSYGTGTRSTEASALSDNETAPFASAHVAEGGLVFDLDLPDAALRLHAQLGYVFTHVEKDMLFDAVSGRNIFFTAAGSSDPVGPSTRHAILFTSRLDYDGWLDVLLNLGWTHGTLDSTGELLPYVPELILRLETAVYGPLFDWKLGHVPVTGRTGLSFTYVPGRPLPYGAFGDPYYLLNLGAEIRLWHFSLGIEMRNLFDLEYRQSELNYASNFDGPDAVRSQRPIRHFVAGEPFTVMGTVTLHLEDLVRGFVEDAPEDPILDWRRATTPRFPETSAMSASDGERRR